MNGSSASSRTASHKTGLALAALDVSPDRTRAIIAGRDILKIVHVDNGACIEDFNLKEKTNQYAASQEAAGHSGGSRYKERIAANDVKWSNGEFATTIATAVANGQIVLYDINRIGVELARLHEHNRQVHRLAFSPHRGNLLLSGSQDASVRLWDIRTLSTERGVLTCQSRSRFPGNSEGIRDVRWCPNDALEFATGTDGGIIQRWDIRKDSSPLVRINAHEKWCSSIDWHPGGKHLISGGADERVKVWDFSSTDRRMKPLWQLRVPFGALNVRWRPASWSADESRLGNWQSTQVAISYARDPRVHIWDLRRPSVSSYKVDDLETAPTDMLWHSEDLMWTVDSSGTFTQTDTKFARRTVEGYNVNPVGIASDGRIVFGTTRNSPTQLPFQDVNDDIAHLERREASRSDKSLTFHSSSQGSYEEPSLLSSTFKHRRAKAPSSLRSTKSRDSTPPSTGPVGAVWSLAQSLQDSFLYKSRQVLGVGFIPGLLNIEILRFLARHSSYPQHSNMGETKQTSISEITAAIKQQEHACKYAGEHRQASTWKILGVAVEQELSDRVQRNVQRRKLEEAAKGNIDQTASVDKAVAFEGFKASLGADDSTLLSTSHKPSNSNSGLERPASSKLPNVENLQIGSAHHELLAGRFTDQSMDAASDPKKMLPSEVQDFAIEKKESNKAPLPALTEPDTSSSSSAQVNLADMDRRLADRRAAMDNYRTQTRTVLKFDSNIENSAQDSQAFNLASHNSNESFEIFPNSVESSSHMHSTSSSFEGNAVSNSLGNSPEETRVLQSQNTRSAMGQAENAMAFEDEAELHAPSSSMSPIEENAKGQKSAALPVAEPPVKGDLARPSTPIPHVVRMEDLDWDSGFKADLPQVMKAVPEDDHYLERDLAIEHTQENNDISLYSPWSATAMLMPLINFHTNQLQDASLPAWIIIYLGPYFYLPIHPGRAQLIILHRIEELETHRLFTEAATLRNAASKIFPAIGDTGHDGVDSGAAWCAGCKKLSKNTLSSYPAKLCERCHQGWGDCAVCNGDGPIQTKRLVNVATVKNPPTTNLNANDSDWGWCETCGHSSHVGCLRIIWSIPDCDGVCPKRGCQCDCMPGNRRDQLNAKLEDELKKKSVVGKDDWNVKESGAVARARGMVGGAGRAGGALSGAGNNNNNNNHNAGGSGAGTGRSQPSAPRPLSLFTSGRSSSGGKKVRIVEPDPRPVRASRGQIESVEDD